MSTTSTKTKKVAESRKPVQTYGGKLWVPPADRTFKLQSQIGEVATLKISYGVGTVDAKLYCVGRMVREKGKPKTMKIAVPTTTITCTTTKTIKSSRAGKLVARSCCKPPDAFCQRTGIHYAVCHLFRLDNEQHLSDAKGRMLSKSMREKIMAELCPWLVNTNG